MGRRFSTNNMVGTFSHHRDEDTVIVLLNLQHDSSVAEYEVELPVLRLNVVGGD